MRNGPILVPGSLVPLTPLTTDVIVYVNNTPRQDAPTNGCYIPKPLVHPGPHDLFRRASREARNTESENLYIHTFFLHSGSEPDANEPQGLGEKTTL